MRVLLVDNHTIVRVALRLLLEDEPDIEVVGEASDGRQGVELTGQLHPDIVLMDVSMPIMDGLQATRAIHAAHPEVCVIGLSMYEMHEQAAAMRAAGALEYVTKSAPPGQVVEVMRACYTRRRDPLPPLAA